MEHLAARAMLGMLSWRPIADRLLSATFQHSLGQLQVIVAYAPTELAAADIKDRFYQDLDHTLSSLQPAQPTTILGDFSAISGRQRDLHRGVVGPHGHSTPNDNTERLLNFCAGGGFRIGRSWFQRKNIHRLSWFSNDKSTAKEIDHVLVNTRWSLLQNCRVYRSLEFDSDHLAAVIFQL